MLTRRRLNIFSSITFVGPKSVLKAEVQYNYYSKFFVGAFQSVVKQVKYGFPLYFQILLGQWEKVILEIPYGLLKFLVHFPPIKTATVVFSSN